MRERHDCGCRECPCTSSADASQPLCPSCSVGIHRPPRALKVHLERGLDRWIELMPRTGGSSGASDKQLAIAHEAWAAWHAEQQAYCPAGCPWLVAS
jgi:hypothetical protein